MDLLIRALLLLLALLAAASANTVAAKACDDPLVCYLNSLVFQLPDFCTTLSNGKDFCIEDFKCEGVQLSSIPSSYKSPTTLGFGVHGLGTSCAAKTKYGRLPGEVSVLIQDVGLDANLLIHKKGEYANSLRLPYCNVTSIYVGVDFSDPILEAFAGQISAAIEKVVYKATCVGLNAILMTNVTNFVNDKLNPALEVIVASPASPYPQFSERYLDWNDSAVSKLHHIVDKVQGLSNLPDFVRCMVQADEGRSLYQTVNQMLQLLPWETSLPSSVSVYSSQSVSVTLDGLSLSGLDTIGDLQILEPLGSQSKVSMRSSLSFEHLALNVSLKLHIQGSDNNGQPVVYEENLLVELQLSDLSAVIDLTVALDDFYLQSMYLDQLSNAGCWVQPLSELSLPNLDLHINPQTLRIVQVTGGSAGLLEHDIVQLLDNALLLLLNPSGFNQLVQDVLHGAVQGPLRQQLNNQLSNSLLQLRSEQPCLTHYPYNDEVQLVDWRYSQLIAVIDGLLNQYLGPAGVNQLLLCATDNTGSISVQTKFLQIAVSGLDSFYSFSLLAPLVTESTSAAINSVYELSSSLGLGICDSSLCKPLTITISGSRALLDQIATSVSSSLAKSLGSYQLSVTLDNFLMSLTSFLAWDFNAVRDLQQVQLSETGCLPSTLQNASLQNATFLASQVQLKIASSAEAVGVQKDITKLVNGILAKLTQPSHLDNHNAQMADHLEQATLTCANKGVKPDVIDVQGNGEVTVHDNDLFLGELSWQWELFVLCLACIACLAGLLLVYQYFGSSRPRRATAKTLRSGNSKQDLLVAANGEDGTVNANTGCWRMRCLAYGAALLDYSDTDTELDSNNFANSAEDDDEKSLLVEEDEQLTLFKVLYLLCWIKGSAHFLYKRWRCKDSLVFHRSIPFIVRMSVPVVIVTNIFLFIQSNLAADAVSVMVSITTGTSTVHDVGSIFDFGLGSTVHDMWEAGVYPLAILIAFFSGAWPYVKLFVMLCSWILPPGIVTSHRRESLLVLLDMLGKWSLVDFFVMVLMLCAFYFELVVYPNVMVVTVTVKPAWGFYSFLLATMVSLGLGHTILAAHRLVTEPKLPAADSQETCLALEQTESLATAPYHVSCVVWDRQEEMELLQRVAQEEQLLLLSEQQLLVAQNTAINGNSNNSAGYFAEMDFEPQSLGQNQGLGVGAMSLAGDNNNNDSNNSNGSNNISGTPNDSQQMLRRRRTLNNSTTNNNTLANANSNRRAHSASSRHTSVDHNNNGHHHSHHHANSKYFPEALVWSEVRITTLGSAFIAVVIAASLFALIAGLWLPTMGFHFEGLTGYMLKSASKVNYSYVSIGTALPTHSGVPNSFAIRWLQASYFLFGVAMPVAFLLSLAVLWLKPLTLQRQRQLHVLAEVLNAWSTLDVFCISIVAALLEIQQFAAFIVGDSCDGINQILAKPTLDEQLDGDDKCFDVQAYVKTASWVLFLAAGLLIVLGVPSLAAAHVTIKRRLSDLGAKHPDHTSHTNSNTTNDANVSSSNSRMLKDEEALSLGLGLGLGNNNTSNSELSQQRDSELSRPLLSEHDLSTSSSLQQQPELLMANNNSNSDAQNQLMNSGSTGRTNDTEGNNGVVVKSARWQQRETRALQALSRHRTDHAWLRAMRHFCTSQTVMVASLRALQMLGLVTVRPFDPKTNSVITSNDTTTNNSTNSSSNSRAHSGDATCHLSSPISMTSPTLHFGDIYQQQHAGNNSNLSPMLLAYPPHLQQQFVSSSCANNNDNSSNSTNSNGLFSPVRENNNSTNNTNANTNTNTNAAEPLLLSPPSLLTC